jgi:hypothetical protein
LCLWLNGQIIYKWWKKNNEKYFRDGVHLTPEGSQMYADVKCKRLISFPVAKNTEKLSI